MRVSEEFDDLCEGLISLRKQNGALTGISTSEVLLNERSSKQIDKLFKRRD